MISLQSKLQQIGAKLATVTTHCVHYYRHPTALPFLIWQESGEGVSFHADNGKREQTISGTVDVFTQTEFDTVLDDVQDALEDLGLAWSLNSVQYEEDTKLIHYEWIWEVRNSGTV